MIKLIVLLGLFILVAGLALAFSSISSESFAFGSVGDCGVILIFAGIAFMVLALCTPEPTNVKPSPKSQN
jgi:hypothetical protein